MATIPVACANCNSRDGAYTVDEFNCHNCGRLTRSDGTLVPLEEQYGKDYVAPEAVPAETPAQPEAASPTESEVAPDGQGSDAG